MSHIPYPLPCRPLTFFLTPGSDQDRQAMQMAESRGVPSRDYMPLAETDVDIELQADTINMGDNFKLTLNIKNQTSQKCTLSATITGCAAYYTGVTSSIFMLESKTATVDPWKSESDFTSFLAHAFKIT